MFGSRREPNLMEGRKVVWRSSPTNGVPLSEVMSSLYEFATGYPGDQSQLMFGYWEYGDEFVVTAPEDAANKRT